MKSIVLCENSLVEQKDESMVLNENGDEVNEKKILINSNVEKSVIKLSENVANESSKKADCLESGKVIFDYAVSKDEDSAEDKSNSQLLNNKCMNDSEVNGNVSPKTQDPEEKLCNLENLVSKPNNQVENDFSSNSEQKNGEVIEQNEGVKSDDERSREEKSKKEESDKECEESDEFQAHSLVSEEETSIMDQKDVNGTVSAIDNDTITEDETSKKNVKEDDNLISNSDKKVCEKSEKCSKLSSSPKIADELNGSTEVEDPSNEETSTNELYEELHVEGNSKGNSNEIALKSESQVQKVAETYIMDVDMENTEHSNAENLDQEKVNSFKSEFDKSNLISVTKNDNIKNEGNDSRISVKRHILSNEETFAKKIRINNDDVEEAKTGKKESGENYRILEDCEMQDDVNTKEVDGFSLERFSENCSSKSEILENSRRPNRKKSIVEASILASLRGTLKNLTRSDLEELIVQKLCEVITERSNVGELRRKAQALEENQERWKNKVQSLTKQMKDMEMVMKKYMNEVHKQMKEGNNQMVLPLRVTRSVGLQVSFYSNANKLIKPSSAQPTPNFSVHNVNGKSVKPVSQKSPTQSSVLLPNVRNKPVPVNQRPPLIPQKLPVQSQRKSLPRPECMPGPQQRQMMPQSTLHNRVVQNASSRNNVKQVPVIQYPQQHHQEQQNSSKVIDLTDDDDKSAVVKSPGSVRVLNQTHQSQVPQNKLTYLLPATSTATTTLTNGSYRQILAAPVVPQGNTQMMSMPPLLFKGGIGGGNSPQVGSQTQVLNQPGRVIFPKPLKHPAPLPQQPVNQCQKPNSKLLPPRPALKISRVHTGIVLSWNMSLGPQHAPISSYQLYAYQEGTSPPATSLWKKVGDVKALPLPMACTLTQFMSGHKYHFAVRAVDLFSRIGPFSFPGTIVLVK